ncbi:T9SS type A sorting domain-containing protein [Bacteroidota bacterium]
MKKIYLLSLALLIPFLLNSQVCVTLYQGDDFDLEDRENRLEVIGMDQNGDMWYGLKGLFNLVGKFDGSSWTTVNASLLPDPRPADIAFDKADSIWIATNKGIGIVHIDSMKGRTMKPSNSDLPEANVTAIAVDSNNIKWIGFSSGKVISYDGATFTSHKEWTNSPVNAIEIAYDSSVWVGLGDSPGIVVYKNGTWTSNLTVKSVPAIESDKWGRVMVASGDSMIIYNNNLTNVVYAAPGNTIRDITVRDNGGIWASSGQGLLVRSGKRFITFSHKNSAVPSQLSDPIAFDSEDHLWFGYTYLVGFNGYSGTGYLHRELVQERAVITADKPSLIFCYGDSITLEAESDKLSFVWPDESNTDYQFRVYDSDTVEVAVEGDNRCFYYDTIRVNAQKVYEDEKVCAVSVDSNGRNIIIWERTPDVGTESFNIYRELTTDSFEFIKNISFGTLSVFEDKDVDPTQRSAKYRISAVDTCGNESGWSIYHRTIHLQLSKGLQDGWINLDWSAYEGLDFPHYIITKGSHPDSMKILTTMPSSNFKYTDKDVFDTVYYRIIIPLPEECAPAGNTKAGTGPYQHTLSNMDNNKKLLEEDPGYTGKLAAFELRAYPNPFSDVTRIEFPNPGNKAHHLSVYNLSGKLVREISGITGQEIYFERKNLDAGYYVFELRGEKLFRGKFVIR